MNKRCTEQGDVTLRDVSRRSLLQVAGSTLLGSVASRLGAQQTATYRVGVGRSPNPYEATIRAITACGEWGSLSLTGKTVVIKPNLVYSSAPDTGITTDSEVTRAVIDRVLAANPASVKLVETSQSGAYFSACGYDGFRTYDSRIELIDLNTQPYVLAQLPYAMAYPAVWMPSIVLASNVVYISIGKLKTHIEAMATLTLKNSFALPKIDRYPSPTPYYPYAPRLGMHDRGLNQTIADINRLRPIHFAVIDGIWGMEDQGPVYGTPIRMDTVIAGVNAVAVDRVGVAAMQIPQSHVPSLTYAARAGLGPADLSQITIAGDTLLPRPFIRPLTPVTIEYPRVSPIAFRPSAGQSVTVTTWYAETCARLIDILRLYDETAVVDRIRTLSGYALRSAGFEQVVWDGRDSAGNLAPPGRYAAHLRAHRTAPARPADGVGWLWVLA